MVAIGRLPFADGCLRLPVGLRCFPEYALWLLCLRKDRQYDLGSNDASSDRLCLDRISAGLPRVYLKQKAAVADHIRSEYPSGFFTARFCCTGNSTVFPPMVTQSDFDFATYPWDPVSFRQSLGG